jgi:uncharacterized protein YndB with AHSA1/START domain
MSSATGTGERACVHSRLIDAPRERVFAAIADAQQLARWWGPNGFTSTFDHFDFRPDGHWRFVLHGPDGSDYPNENVFVQIVAPERVVIDHPSDTHHFVLTITLDDEAGRTRVGWQQLFDSAEHRELVAAVVLAANEQNLDRLDVVVREGA